MSLNGVKEELTFTQREHEQAFLAANKTLRPDFIKTNNKGLRAFIFYRNLLSLLASQRKKKLLVGKNNIDLPPITIRNHKR
jgi:hypothetical protein